MKSNVNEIDKIIGKDSQRLSVLVDIQFLIKKIVDKEVKKQRKARDEYWKNKIQTIIDGFDFAGFDKKELEAVLQCSGINKLINKK